MKNGTVLRRAQLVGIGLLAVCLMSCSHRSNQEPAGVVKSCPAGEVPAFPGADTCILDPESIPKY
ncbi:MAG: hypothetical protein P8Y63_07285, partial [Deltaproteobacteria bacterium]